jgi:hypothetical protein
MLIAMGRIAGGYLAGVVKPLMSGVVAHAHACERVSNLATRTSHDS